MRRFWNRPKIIFGGLSGLAITAAIFVALLIFLFLMTLLVGWFLEK